MSLHKFAIYCLIFAYLLVSIACFPKIHEEHEFEIPVRTSDPNSDENILLTIVEEGEWVLAVDGGFRRTSFSEAKYSVAIAEKRVELPILGVKDPVELWDSFARIDGNLHAIDVTGSAYREERPHIKVLKLNRNAPGDLFKCNIEEFDCQIESMFISATGDTLLIDNKFDRYHSCSLLEKDSHIVEISKEEFSEQIRDSIQLDNQPIFINMGSSGHFGQWCQ